MNAKRTIMAVAIMMVLVLGTDAFAGKRGGRRGDGGRDRHRRKDRTKLAVAIGPIGAKVVLRDGKIKTACMNVARASGKVNRASGVVVRAGDRHHRRHRNRRPARIGRPVHVGRHGIPVGRHGRWARRHRNCNWRCWCKNGWNRRRYGWRGKRWYRRGCWITPTIVIGGHGNYDRNDQITDDVVTVWIVNDNGSESPVELTKQQYGRGYIGPKGEYYSEMPTNDQLKMLYGLDVAGAENGTVVVWVTKPDGSETPVMLILAEDGNGYFGPEGEFYSEMPTKHQLRKRYGN